MMIRPILTLICLLAGFIQATAQTCTTPGQNPSSAFPVCGTSTFSQTTVPLCGGRSMPNPFCTSDGLKDVNPFWYKFTCFKSGTLGLLIIPNNLDDDYDWEIYDITGRNPDDVYRDGKLVIASNWSGESGRTGASSNSGDLFVCGGFGKPLFSKMPTLIEGHNYLLLVSHFTRSQSGYDLSFLGGTAVITDATLPKLQTAEANCGGDIIKLKLNKKIKCSSIDEDGSDFTLSVAGVTVTSIKGTGCFTGFDTDSMLLQLSRPLDPGTYTLKPKVGFNGHTLLDYCNNALPLSDEISFTVAPRQPTPMDSLVTVKCAPNSLTLVFRKPITCSTVASDGSDFAVTGPSAVTVTNAKATCTGSNSAAKEIIITLAKPIQQGGSYTLSLKKGSDGNTVKDECGEETPAGSSITFTIKDTVNADFTYTKLYGCTTDTVNYFHTGANGVNSWKWSLDDGKSSTAQSPQALYTVFDTKTVQLVVSNGFCSDTASQHVVLENALKADFNVFEDNCPAEPVQFTGTSTGKIMDYQWSFGDGGTATEASSTHIYNTPGITTAYTVRYTVTDSLGCQSTAVKPVTIYVSCYLAVPTGFTPNMDGRNDQLRVLNAIKAEKLEFKVFNRWGQLLFKTTDWKQGWDGTLKGVKQPTGVYIWFLSFIDRDSKLKREMKGTATLIR